MAAGMRLYHTLRGRVAVPAGEPTGTEGPIATQDHTPTFIRS
jgi:hypothetical protein